MRIRILIGIMAASLAAVHAAAQGRRDLKRALTFYSSFDHGTDADFGSGDRSIYTAPTYKAQMEAKAGIGNPDVSIVPGAGKFGDALRFARKNTMAIFYKADGNVVNRGENFTGTVSFWLNLDPNTDLEPGFCDPIQITDDAYNDSAFWVDFTKDERPRHFRLGAFGDLKSWNPQNLPSDKNPDFNKRLVAVTKPPFASGAWTHIAITWSGLGAKESNGTAKLYLNGNLQGTAADIREPFNWDLSRTAIRLGVNYVGLFDELAVFNRALTDSEIGDVYRMKKSPWGKKQGGKGKRKKKA